MSDYKDIPLEIGRERRCCFCHAELPGSVSPWSICFDPNEGTSTGTGDHEPRGLLCQPCAVKILLTQIVDTY